MSELRNSALFNSYSHRLGSMGRTNRAEDYIGEAGAGFDTYDPGLDYDEGDVVIKDSRFFEANSDIPAGTLFIIGTGGATWKELSPAVGNAKILAHDPTGTYEQGDVCIRAGYLVFANKNVTNGGVDADWDSVSVTMAKYSTIATMAAGLVLETGQPFMYNGNLWIATSGYTSADGSVNETRSLQLTFGGLEINFYDSTKEWEKDSVVIYQYRFYMANELIPANTLFAEGDSGQTWRPFAGGTEETPVTLFNPALVYNEGDRVRHYGMVFVRNSSARAVNAPMSLLHFSREIERGVVRGEYHADDVYLKDDIVSKDGSEYIANSIVNTGFPFVEGLSGATFRRTTPLLFQVIEDTTQYFKMDMFPISGSVYIAKEDFLTAGELDPDKITSLIKVNTSGSSVMPAVGDPGAPTGTATSPTGVQYNIIAGKDVAEALILLMYPASTPPQTPPSIILTAPITEIEVGEDITLAFNWSFGLGDSNGKDGDATFIYPTGSDSGITTSPVTPTTPVTAQEGDNMFELTQDYLEGDIPVNSYGEPVPSAKLPAGTARGTASIVGKWPTFVMGAAVDQTTDHTAGSNLARRAKLTTLCGAKQLAPKTSYGAGVIPANKYIYFAVPGTYTTITTMYAGFPTPVAEILDSNYVISDPLDVYTKPYTLVRLNGNVLDTNYDSIVLS